MQRNTNKRPLGVPDRRIRAALVGVALAAAALIPTVGGCSREDALRERLARSSSELEGPELLEALLALDQEYPDELILKVNIGALYLASGDPRRASPYLTRGRALARARAPAGGRLLPSRSQDRHLLYLLFGNLAELALRTGGYTESVAHADQALRLERQDPLGVILTRAKARLASGALDPALADFQEGLRLDAQRLNPEDHTAYIQALVAAGDLQRAAEQYRARQRGFGYIPGQGLEESTLFERFGRIEEAILSAFMEYEYLRARGDIDATRLRRNLAVLSERLNDPALNPRGEGKQMIVALGGFLDEDWQRVATVLPATTAAASHPFLEFLACVAALEQAAGTSAGVPDLAAMARYVALEAMFKDLQSYYYHLWRAMLAAPEVYPPPIARPVLERTILLGPDSRQARRSREELGALLGLTQEQSRHLLLDPEIAVIAAQAQARGQPALLEPLIALIALPDTPYGARAGLALRDAVTDPAVRDYLERRRGECSGRLAASLTALLGSYPPGRPPGP